MWLWRLSVNVRPRFYQCTCIFIFLSNPWFISGSFHKPENQNPETLAPWMSRCILCLANNTKVLEGGIHLTPELFNFSLWAPFLCFTLSHYDNIITVGEVEVNIKTLSTFSQILFHRFFISLKSSVLSHHTCFQANGSLFYRFFKSFGLIKWIVHIFAIISRVAKIPVTVIFWISLPYCDGVKSSQGHIREGQWV